MHCVTGRKGVRGFSSNSNRHNTPFHFIPNIMRIRLMFPCT
uniref:Uncharacterized protein n=1 Tax=Anguilla anguilla TaxID=7936 RepID=A0A0E9Q938_ANGAN